MLRLVPALAVVLFSIVLWGCSTAPAAPDAACVLGNWTQACKDLLPDGALDAAADASPAGDVGADAAVDGAPAPTATRYARCPGAASCTAPEACHEVLPDAGATCLTRCTTNADCPLAPAGGAAAPTCGRDGWCFLACAPSFPCPAPLECRMLSAEVGFCR